MHVIEGVKDAQHHVKLLGQRKSCHVIEMEMRVGTPACGDLQHFGREVDARQSQPRPEPGEDRASAATEFEH